MDRMQSTPGFPIGYGKKTGVSVTLGGAYANIFKVARNDINLSIGRGGARTPPKKPGFFWDF